jgi:hypothetical protein
LEGGVCSLEIEGANALMDLDLSGCQRLDHASCEGAPPNLTVNALGCVKLRRIDGVEAILAESSGLADQILQNQSMSRRDGTLYPSMTFTDIDLVADLINEGVKAMSRAGLLDGYGPMLGRYDLLAYEPRFNPLAYRILSPLEPVYTGGTGETYSYVFIERDVNPDDLEVSDDEGVGNASPEDCLRYMLQWTTNMRASSLPRLNDASDDGLLEFLKDFSERATTDASQALPIRLSAMIDSSERQTLLELVGEVGMKVLDDDVERFIYVYPEAGIPPEDKEISWSATLSVDSSAAWNQLTRLRDWMGTRSEATR